MINRLKTKNILNSIANFPAIGIVGPRQCGKTTLVKLLQKKIEKESIYLDLESRKDRAVVSDPELFFQNNIDKTIILDEVQTMPEIFPLIRSSIDKKKESGRFILLGSSSPALLRKANESLAGRISYHELTPFTTEECSYSKKHFLVGGYPDPYLGKNEEFAFEWLENYIQSYVERDLPALGLNTSSENIYKLLRMVAHIHSNILNIQQLATAIGVSASSISRYLDFLEDAFLIRRLQSFHFNAKKRLIKAPKIYIRDSGIFHSLINIQSMKDLEFHPQIGASWEGYVVEQICNSLPKNLQPYFYRTQHGNEVDLILAKGTKPVYLIEIKYSLSPSIGKGFRLSIEELSSTSNYFITPGEDSFALEKNVHVNSLKDFISSLH